MVNIGELERNRTSNLPCAQRQGQLGRRQIVMHVENFMDKRVEPCHTPFPPFGCVVRE